MRIILRCDALSRVAVFPFSGKRRHGVQSELVHGVLWSGTVYVAPGTPSSPSDSETVLCEPADRDELFTACFDIFSRHVDPVEPDIVEFLLFMISQGMEQHHALRRTMNAMGRAYAGRYDFYERVLQLPRATLDIFLARRVSFSVLFDTDEDVAREVVLELVRRCSGSPKQFMHAVGLVRDIALRDNCSHESVLDEELMPLTDDDIHPRQVMKLFVERLKKRRTPRWHSLSTRAKSLTDRIRARTGITVSVPRFFEGDRVEMTLRVDTFESFEKRVTLIRENRDDFTAVMQLMRSDDASD